MLKITMLLSLLALTTLAHAHTAWQLVDIGFHGADKHIAIELTSVDGEDALKFSLSSDTASGKAIPVSKCAYTQASLEQEVQNIADPMVKADFDWIFFRSGYSGTALDQFYPEFKALLERSNPHCPVLDLQQLKDQLDVLKG